MNLRPYQNTCKERTLESLRHSKSALIVMPTGTGKTIVFVSIADAITDGRVMVIAHRKELIDQAAAKIYQVTGKIPSIEMADQWADTNSYKARYVVSSVQTQNAGQNGDGRMSRFDPNEFSLLIVDEAHHSTAPSYKKMIEHYRQNPECRVIGVTATPDRKDEQALGQIFETVSYDYEIPDAIDHGWLVPIHQEMIDVESLDLSDVRTQAGDLHQAELAAVMEYEQTLHEVAAPTFEISNGRKTLVFATRVHHAERLSEIFNRWKPGSAAVVHGGTAKDVRAEIFHQFADGRIQFLCNVGVATEGYDCPGIEMIAIARPTKSRALYCQMVGRGTRALTGVLDPLQEASDEERRQAIMDSAKTYLHILDFVGNSGRHKLITTADILGGNYDEKVIELANARAKAIEGPIDMKEMLEQSMKDIIKQKKEQAAREAERRSRIKVKAKYNRKAVHPFDVLDIMPQRLKGWDNDETPSEKQMSALAKFGVGDERWKLNKREATQLMGRLIKNRRAGLYTYKQAALLKRYGIDRRLSFQQASKVIDQIASNGWKAPDHVRI